MHIVELLRRAAIQQSPSPLTPIFGLLCVDDFVNSPHKIAPADTHRWITRGPRRSWYNDTYQHLETACGYPAITTRAHEYALFAVRLRSCQFLTQNRPRRYTNHSRTRITALRDKTRICIGSSPSWPPSEGIRFTRRCARCILFWHRARDQDAPPTQNNRTRPDVQNND